MKMTSLDPRFVCVRSFMEFDFLHAKVISHKKKKRKTAGGQNTDNGKSRYGDSKPWVHLVKKVDSLTLIFIGNLNKFDSLDIRI